MQSKRKLLNKRKKDRGYFIVMMFFIMVILSALAATYSAFVIKQLQYAGHLEKEILLREIAESGQRYARYSLQQDASFRKSPGAISCGSGEFSVEILPRGDFYIIRSFARIEDREKQMESVYRK